MREIFARLVAVLTVAVVVGLALLFAVRHNPSAAAKAPPSSDAPATSKTPAAKKSEGEGSRPGLAEESAPSVAKTRELITRGRAVYAQQNCAACHSIAGDGNPRAPLDDVGARHDVAQLRAWITGTGAAAELLAPATVRRKQRYLSIPAGDLDALIAYLSALKPAR